MDGERSFVKSLLSLPIFKELDAEDVKLSAEEEQELQAEVKQALMRYLTNLPAFQELERRDE